MLTPRSLLCTSDTATSLSESQGEIKSTTLFSQAESSERPPIIIKSQDREKKKTKERFRFFSEGRKKIEWNRRDFFMTES